MVDAVLAAQSHNPARAARAVDQLEVWVSRLDWNSILPAYARCVRITREFPSYTYLPSPGSGTCRERFVPGYCRLPRLPQERQAPWMISSNAFLPMIPTINRFFDLVLVMVDDEQTRQNRLGLLTAHRRPGGRCGRYVSSGRIFDSFESFRYKDPISITSH